MAETLFHYCDNPAATTLTDLFALRAGAYAVLSSIVVCNHDAGAGSFRIAHAPAAEADDASHYVYFDEALAAKTTFAATLGIVLEPTDVLRIYASNANMSFHVSGSRV